MEFLSSENRRPGKANPTIAGVIATIRHAYLRVVVERLAVPRPHGSQANRDASSWLNAELRTMGYAVYHQGQHDNLVATWPGTQPPKLLVGAHYDSVVGSPGADDNASAVAALLACASTLATSPPAQPVAFALFNREEENFLGSLNFVETFLPTAAWDLREVHILEMVGFCSRAPGSQRYPTGLPTTPRSTGDFLALVANHDSNQIIAPIMDSSRSYQPDFPILGLKVDLGLESHLPDLLRSDHVPFWLQRIPAVMWTDTSEFRNPNYHGLGDTPDTLDYEFMAAVTRALTLHCLRAG